MKIMSKSEAKAAGLKHFFTGKPCIRGGVGMRITSTGNCLCERCKAITKVKKSEAYKKDRESKEWLTKQKCIRDKNKKRKREYDRAYRDATRDQQREWSRAWEAKNKDKVKAMKHNYKIRRRAKEKAGISNKELIDWCISQIKICYWCNVECKDNYHIDHYSPLAKDGLHEISNLVIACPPCNMRKKAKDPFDFANEVGRLF